jgi:uncharacterized membrane protein YwzB
MQNQNAAQAQVRNRRDAIKKIMLIKLLVYLILIINIIKYLCIDVPKIENYLKEKRLDDIWIRIFIIVVILGKIAENFLAGYFYYLPVPLIISMIKNDDNILSKIREVMRLIR